MQVDVRKILLFTKYSQGEQQKEGTTAIVEKQNKNNWSNVRYK